MSADVQLERPSSDRRDEFLDAVRRSGGLHQHFADPPDNGGRYGEWLRRIQGKSHEGHFVVHRGDDALAGVINLNEIVRGTFESGYLGYYALQPYAGRGLMHRGMQLVIARAFGKLGLHRLEANIQPDNAASIALVKRLGFKLEGFSPRYLEIGGVWRDHERWALLQPDRADD